MGISSRPCCSDLLLILVLVVMVFGCDRACFVEARPLSTPQREYSKIMETLGVVCKCCDGPGGECNSITTTSTSLHSCSNLQCLPWKLN